MRPPQFDLCILRQDAGERAAQRFVTYGSYSEEEFRELFAEAGIAFETLPRSPAVIGYKP